MHRLLPPLVFVFVSAIGLGMTWTVYRSSATDENARFKETANEVVDRITGRIGQHVSMLQATHSLLAAVDGKVDHDHFRTFVAGLDLAGTYSGVQGLGYAELIPTGEEERSERNLKAYYGLDRKVWPETTVEWRTPIVLIEPANPRNEAALGFDMFGEERRRAAMRQAIETGEATASAPVQLVQEITEDKQAGFLVYLPFHADGKPDRTGNGTFRLPDGFVYAPFRAGDFHQAALSKQPVLPVVLETFDVTDGNPVLLFRSGAFDALAAPRGMAVDLTADIMGRTWQFRIHSTLGWSDQSDFMAVYGLGAISLVLAFSLAALAHSQYRGFAAIRALAEANARSLQEKELMLQEMKHRMKNALARVLAIARQTAANSESLDHFTSSFSARVMAMSNAQDMLTRSRWQKADLDSLLRMELVQVLGEDLIDKALYGPPVEVNERATQALGLVFHELATNALKYGGVSDEGGALEVRWAWETAGRDRFLSIVWTETRPQASEQPLPPAEERKGFGTRLIRVNVEGELRGTVEREVSAASTVIRIRLPLRSLA
ncbi:CHASE domain-containing protein [Polymorphum gilvum]|uniref:histidine kinase n=1 Tax=Polymorphum gilvum (strain LMG 25793 / CGMCC 1.9160 / SL003B-26A1) TaxID=991905 RepID=F2J6V0_POLGS|nr:CHASE domain-containing protein [Polymorphum gilvum]ADZ72583.1 Sensory transduction histidine kinase [Polymorphum gilvum SL003B-26A1]